MPATPPIPAMPAGVTGRRGRRLQRLMMRFVTAESWAASREIMQRHPVLLSDEADAVLAGLAARATAEGDDHSASSFEARRSVLLRCRVAGPGVFEELMAGDVPAPLRARWVAAEGAYERYRSRPGRSTVAAAVSAVTGVVHDPAFGDVPGGRRAGMLQAAGTLLGQRYQWYGGRPADLDDAIAAFADAVADAVEDDVDRPSYLSGLGAALGLRYERLGDVADLDRAISYSRDALAAAPPADRPSLSHNLAANLAVRYQTRGNPADLTEAIDTARAALAAQSSGPTRTILVSGLAGLLVDRFEQRGTLDDLETAIRLAGEMPAEATPGDRAVLLAALGTALQRHAERSGPGEAAEEADAAVTYLEAATQVLDRRRSPHRVNSLAALGQAYLTRFQITSSADDLRRARGTLVRAIRKAGQRGPQAALLRSQRGAIELALVEAQVPGVDLGQVMADLAAAAHDSTSQPRIRPMLLANLAAGHRIRHQVAGDPADIPAGVDAYRRACQGASDTDPEMALAAAADWARWASTRHDWTEACEAYETAFDAADRLWRNQVSRAAKESWLAETSALTPDAVVAAGRAGRPSRSALFAEQGRARLLAESLDITGLDLERLNARDRSLAARYRAARDRMLALEADVAKARALTPRPPSLIVPADR
jgi:hypothetical protein